MSEREREETTLFERGMGWVINSRLPGWLIIVSVLLGALALHWTPREEEPQIVVPMIDVYVAAPGLDSRQVERQVTVPLEKLLAQLVGVEHVYSTSMAGQAVVTLRFYVGENREAALLNTYNKLYSNQDSIPAVVSQWMLKPIEVDDVPILLFSLWSDQPALYDDFALRRMADEVSTLLQAVPDTSEVNVTGGRARQVNVLLQPESLTARQTSALDVVQAIQLSNQLQNAGEWVFGNHSMQLQSGDVLRGAAQLPDLVVNVVNGVPVLLREVAEIVDGPAEATSYTRLAFAPGHPAYSGNEDFPAVSISVAKQRGSNAVTVSNAVKQQLQEIQATILPQQVHVEFLRDYGETANEKVNNLTSSLAFAVLTVVIFIGVFMGWRPALVVGLAVPVCYGVTLLLDWYFGYSINRVTLFALILSLGLLVDDPITGVDNIDRLLGKTGDKTRDIVAAIHEIRVPLVMSTITIVLAFLPLAYITGMMGPYMAPMAFNVPVSVITSTTVAFLITPWIAGKLLKPRAHRTDGDGLVSDSNRLYRFSSALLLPLFAKRSRIYWVLTGVAVLFVLSALLPVLRLVPLKLLPFDNKNEIQIVIDMPEGTTLEETAAFTQQIASIAKHLPEVSALASFVGEPSAIDFNGMVRRYYQRVGANMADIRITLVDKTLREQQSHGVVLRLRELLQPITGNDARVKVVEVPPGPPVLSTLVAELYGTPATDYSALQAGASALMARLSREAWVVGIDSTVQADNNRLRFVTDKTKAALSGVATADINQTLALANAGTVAGYVYDANEAKPLPIQLRLPREQRTSLHDFASLPVKGRAGIVQQSQASGLESAPQPLVPLGELGVFEEQLEDQPIFHKNLRPVVYVMAELSGRVPADIIADVYADRSVAGEAPAAVDSAAKTSWQERSFLNSGAGDGWTLPDGVEAVWGGEGEWQITVRVFRDMGIAFGVVILGILLVLRIQTGAWSLAAIIISAIPLTVIGIMPGFWLLNQFGERVIGGAPEPVLFTATAMIGMIALAGIVVRNSLILVEFIGQAREHGLALVDALVQAGAVRMRPILLTAGTTLLGNLVIILDPVFSGLALAIMFGILASTLFTLVVVPLVYFLIFSTPQASLSDSKESP